MSCLIKILSRTAIICFSLLALLVILSQCLLSQILIGTEKGPMTLYGLDFTNTNFLRFGQDSFPRDSFGYPGMRDAGFNYDWTGTRAARDDSIGVISHAEALRETGIKAYLRPGIAEFNDTLVDAAVCWVSEKTAHKQPGGEVPIYHNDFFGRAENQTYGLGSSGTRIDNGAGGWYWQGDHDPGGFIIGLHRGGEHYLLDSNWVYPRRYYAFFRGNDSLHIWLKMKRISNNHPNDPLCTFYVYLHRGQKIDSVTWIGNQIPTDSFAYIKFNPSGIGHTSDWYQRSNVKFALRWCGNDNVAVSHFAYAENNYMLVNPDSGDANFHGRFLECISQECENINRTPNGFVRPTKVMIGIFGEEVYRYGYTTYCQLKNSIEPFAPANQPLFPPSITALSPGYGLTDLGDFLDQTGVGSLALDMWVIENDIVENFGQDPDAIQEAWDNYTAGYQGQEGIAQGRGLGPARILCNQRGIPLWAGIQSSGELKIINHNPELWEKQWEGEPTPEMVKCQGFLAMCYHAEGFFYSYYAPGYRKEWSVVGDTINGYTTISDWFAIHPNGDPGNIYNGAAHSGLTTFWHNRNDSTIDTPEELEEARRGNNGTGVLRLNAKGRAAKEFNNYIRTVESTYEQLCYMTSSCIEDENPVEYVEIDSTYIFSHNPVDSLPVPDEQRWVQVGIFGTDIVGIPEWELGHFMIVNRRCDTNGGRWIKCNVNFGMANYHFISDIATGAIVCEGWGDLSFRYWLGPGEGRLFRKYGDWHRSNHVTIDEEWTGMVIISDTIQVFNGATLTIEPGTHIVFSGNGLLEVLGSLKAVGDSLSPILFYNENSSSNGYVELQGIGDDTLTYCKFSNLNYGLKVNKETTGDTYIDHSDFSFSKNEGLVVSGGNCLTISNSNIYSNLKDGGYFYNCKVNMDKCNILRNSYSGLYLYTINSNSSLSELNISMNGRALSSYIDGNINFYNCSPSLKKSAIELCEQFGLYGANGSYPVMFQGTTNAANSISDNASHETYWQNSWPLLDYGHNNFSTEDDTLIYIDGSSPTMLMARGNYWGGGAPDTSSSCESVSYIGPGSLKYSPYDTEEQFHAPYREQLDPGFTKKEGEVRVNDAEEDALDAFRNILSRLEREHRRPVDEFEDYRGFIADHYPSSAAPMVLERMLWLAKSRFEGRDRTNRLEAVTRYLQTLADTTEARALAWKARRLALWGLAAQRRYDQAIRGFEAIVAHPESLADSVFAVIDAGTLHLEAREWARRDSLDGPDAVFGSRKSLCPVDFPTHRKHTDELLALLRNPNATAYRSLIPTEYSLDQNYPNPFNEFTRIRFGLPKAGWVKVFIYDLLGRKVATLADENRQAGYHQVVWKGTNLTNLPAASGVYFCRIEAGSFMKVKKLTLVR